MDAAALGRAVAPAPPRPGAYLFRDAGGRPIYVGKANDLRDRLASYRARDVPPKTAAMLEAAASVDWIVAAHEVEALVLEQSLIKHWRPRYNVLLKDDKRYPYVKITNEEWPRVLRVRRIGDDGARYFGPFPNAGAVKRALDVVSRVFKVRRCESPLPVRSRPCLDGEIGRCDGPCCGLVTRERYMDGVRAAEALFEGRSGDLLDRLRAEMRAAAGRRAFERAADLRDAIVAVEALAVPQAAARAGGGSFDAVAVRADGGAGAAAVVEYRDGAVVGLRVHDVEVGGDSPDLLAEVIARIYHGASSIPDEIAVEAPPAGRALLEAWLGARIVVPSARGARARGGGEARRVLGIAARNAALAVRRIVAERSRSTEADAAREIAETLGLDEPPRRIEAFDASNTQAGETVVGQVLFEDGRPRRSGYRTYRVAPGRAPNDVGALREALERRARHGDLPDLVLIDGGPGQLRAALDGLGGQAAETAVVALAKRNEEIYTPYANEPLRLPRSSPALLLLQRIRDEVHRFAHGRHVRARDRRLVESDLLEVPGVGPRRLRALLDRFGSTAGLAEATVDEIAAVPGVGRRTAEAISARVRAPSGSARTPA